MTTRILTCALLLGLASFHAEAAKKSAPPEIAPEDIDVDALARAKDVGAKPVDAAATEASTDTDAATTETTSNEIATSDDTAAEPAAEEAAASTTDAETSSEKTADAKPTDAPPASDEPQAGKTAATASDAPEKSESQSTPIALTPPIDPQEKRQAAACESRARHLLDAAQKGDFTGASTDFDAKMRKAMPADKFSETWASLAQFGALQARGQSHLSKGEGYTLVMTPLIFEHATLVTQVACGSDGRVAGFHIKPLQALQP